jgi:hypothetical protein
MTKSFDQFYVDIRVRNAKLWIFCYLIGKYLLLNIFFIYDYFFKGIFLY